MKTFITASSVQLPPMRKPLSPVLCKFNPVAVLVLALLLAVSSKVSAFILDDFNGASLSSWTTTLNGGSFVQSGGQLTVTTVPFPQALTYGKKTDRTFTPTATHTLEFKVLVNRILTNSVTTNGAAVLGWVPTGGALGANGYAMGVGPLSAALLFNSSFVFLTNFPAPIQTNDLYMALRLTPEGANMIVKSTLYKKADGRYNVIFEYTLTNTTSALVGTAGNAIVGTFNDTSGGSTSVNFDDLTYYDTVRQLLDDFSGPYPGTSWTDYIPGTATNYNDGAGHLVTVDQSSGTTSGTFKSDKSFKISDGVRLELRADVVDATAGPGNFNFVVLGYIPNGIADFGTLKEYHIAYTDQQFYVGKQFGSWWETAFPLAAPRTNVRLIQTLTGEGTSVRIESRLEDLSKDVNEPGRVVYQRMRVDSSSPYLNFDGYYALSQYHNGGVGNDAVVWDNAEVNTVIGGNAAPIISGQTPGDGANFYDAAGGVAFNVNDDASAPMNNIKLILNGVTYTNGSPGVTVTPTTVSSLNRHFTFTNLVPNTFYVGSLVASDNLGATTTLHYEFDTFLTNCLQIEAEDFNYSADLVSGGSFFDGGLNAYAGQKGLQDIDYHDSRNSGNGDNPIPYRPQDFPRQYPTGDPARPQYVAASQPEYLVYDNENGDWRNYTRTFTAGTYNVFSRQSTFALPIGQITLERVTSDRTTSGQTTVVLGAFQQPGDSTGDTGYDVHRDVPLTDAAGNRLVIRMAAGVDTLRVSDRYVNDRNNADVFHNYIVLVPVADPGTLRPVVSMVSPQAGTTSRISNQSEATLAEIANRDTTVNTNTISMTINGSPATIAITETTGGAQVAWSFAALPTASSYTHVLSFQDSDGTNLVTTWSYSYPLLRASNSLPLGALSTRGFHVRTAQAVNGGANLGSSLARAEDQLSVPPVIPADISYEGDITDTLDWNNDNATPKDVPGLSGVPGSPAPLNNIANEALGYVELTSGPKRWNVGSDDGFQIRSGRSPADVNATVIGQQDGATFGGTFDFVVEAPGLYPLRSLWYENGGNAAYTVRSVNLADNSLTLVNDPADPANVVKVYNAVYSVSLYSSASVNGTYAVEAGAVIDVNARTIKTPVPGSPKFYRITAPSNTRIDSVTVSGTDLVLHYKFQ